MSDKKVVNKQIISHMADLAKLQLTQKENQALLKAFFETLQVVNNLQELNVDKIDETYQVNNLQNILREDKVDKKSMFSQKQALINAKKTYQGYFLISQVINKDI